MLVGAQVAGALAKVFLEYRSVSLAELTDTSEMPEATGSVILGQ